MKIEKKILFYYIFNVSFIVIIVAFSIQNMDLLLKKLRFAEIAADLNASFLEMRISEKNYLLYHDPTELSDMDEKIGKTMESVQYMKADILKAIGADNFSQLELYLKKYAETAREIKEKGIQDTNEQRLRAEGKKLREFFKTITQIEREKVNHIVLLSEKILFISFAVILLLSMLVGRFVSRKILKSLQSMERLALLISQGDYEKIDGNTSADEFGSVINAMNLMSEELKTREDEIIQSKKLASLGVLTAGVAHEMINPLNNISMITENFIGLYDSLDRDGHIQMMQKVSEETRRMENVVRNLLDFSKPKEANMKETNINATVRKALKLMQNTLDISNVELELSLQKSLPTVLVDENQIQQVLVNLILNAVHAMPGGGKLYVTTHGDEGEGCMRIKVKDTGKGISSDLLPHIFDPFFTTKGVEGTGLGLSVSYGIIKSHKGSIKAESTPGVGTTFTVKFPIYKKGGGKDVECPVDA